MDIFPRRGHPADERMALELDEFKRGYPRMTLGVLMDVVGACLARSESGGTGKGKKGADDADDAGPAVNPRSKELNTPVGRRALQTRTHAADPPKHSASWKALLGRLARLNRLKGT